MADALSELPHGLTGPLHYFDPSAWRWAAALAALALAAIAFAGWWRRRRAASPAAPQRPVPAPAEAAPAGILARLDGLLLRHVGRGSYRAGCHELSSLLRGHLERRSGRPYSRWTAREAERAEGDTVWTRLLGLVADLQFSRRPPDRADFESLCELARDALQPEAGR